MASNRDNNGEPQITVVMVIDVSASMYSHIDDLTEKYNEFIKKAREKSEINTQLNIATIAFNSDVKIIQKMVKINDDSLNRNVTFEAYGTTNMAGALEQALEIVKNKNQEYSNSNLRYYKPWIILMTDGYPDNDDTIPDVAKKIKKEELHMFCVGLGNHYRKETLRELSGKCFGIEDWNFDIFFSWLIKSLVVVTKNNPGTAGLICDTGSECQDMFNTFYGNF